MNDLNIPDTTASPQGISSPGKRLRPSSSASFGQMLEGSLARISQLQKEADAKINDLATGKDTDIHQTMIAMGKADVSFELLMQIRNKVIAAYEKIMRMPA